MRPTTTMQTLAALQPSFVQMGEMGGFDAVAIQRYPEVEAINHVHTPGNSSGIVDGAAAVLIGSKEAGKAAGLKPRARIRAFANIGSEPAIMLTGPIPVTEKVLKNAGMTTSDIDLWELNEAFASVVLRYMQALDIPHDKINVNGGAIAMGHPLGATGAMILGTVLDELERRNLTPRWSRSASASAWAPRRSSSGCEFSRAVRRSQVRRIGTLRQRSRSRPLATAAPGEVRNRMPKIDIAALPLDTATTIRRRSTRRSRAARASGWARRGLEPVRRQSLHAQAGRGLLAAPLARERRRVRLRARRRSGAGRGRRRNGAEARRRRRLGRRAWRTAIAWSTARTATPSSSRSARAPQAERAHYSDIDMMVSATMPASATRARTASRIAHREFEGTVDVPLREANDSRGECS